MNARIMSFMRCAAVFLVGLIAACTSEVEPLTPAQRQVVAAYVSKVAPSPDHALDFDFEGKVKLLGYDVQRAPWQPGETMRITWYWQVLASVDKGWELFTQIDDPGGERSLDQDGNGTVRWLYGADRWRPGEYIQDPQDLHLPDDWTGSSADIYLGIGRDERRLRVRHGGSEAEGRALAASVPTPASEGAPRKHTAVPSLGVHQTKQPPRLDGSLDDPVWGFAETSRAFVETRKGGVAGIQASAKLLWDARYLYVGVDVSDPLLRASHTQRDAHLWKQDCVELMFDPDGDGKDYFEIQVSPRGVVFDTRYDSRRVPEPFGHIDWDSKVRLGVSTRGTIDDRVADAGYAVEIAIPWQAFRLDGKPVSPPAIGDEWRANLYVMDLGADRQQAAAWSALGIADFHVPRRFGILAFEGPADGMLGTSEPLQISGDRLPKPLERGPALDRGVKDKMIRKRLIDRKHPAEPAPAIMREGTEVLESPEAAH